MSLQPPPCARGCGHRLLSKASVLLGWPPCTPTKKWKSNKPWFPGGFPGLVIGGATQKLINLRLHCQLEQKLSWLRGAKEVLCISRLSVEIICCSGQTSSLVPPHLPACSTSRALQLLTGNSDEQNRARSDTTEKKKGGNGPLSGM